MQRWEPSAGAGEPIAGAGDDLSLQSNEGPWDQFQANEQKFGLKSDYDESIYTTTINRSDPLYAQREAEAQRIAQEIVGTAADSAHMNEERGLTNEDDGLNEEDKSVQSLLPFVTLANGLQVQQCPTSRLSSPTAQSR